MISIEKIKSSLSGSKFKPIKLPNDIAVKYIQQTYTDIKSDNDKLQQRLAEQDAIQQAIKTGIEVNVIKQENITGFSSLIKQSDKVNYKIADVKYSSYINYSENATFDLPEDLRNILTCDEHNEYELKLYGVKNPNSFVKSIIILNDPNYMIFNKYQMNQAVFKWKTNLALHYKQYAKQYSKLPRKDIINIDSLLLSENFHNTAVIQLAACMTNNNIIMLDYINHKYSVHFTDYFIGDNSKHFSGKYNSSLCNNEEFYLIINYNNCYLPIINVHTQHLFKGHIISRLLNDNNFELTNDKYFFNITNSNIINSDNINNINSVNSNTNDIITVINTDSVNNSIHNSIQNDNEPIMLSSLVSIQFKRDTLQRIAIAYGVNIMKEGIRVGSKIKKTKQDLINDFAFIVYDPKIMKSDDF